MDKTTNQKIHELMGKCWHEQQQWVPVEERLPEVSGEYTVTLRGHTPEVARRWMKVEDPGYCRRYFSAWKDDQPYQPPQGGRDDD